MLRTLLALGIAMTLVAGTGTGPPGHLRAGADSACKSGWELIRAIGSRSSLSGITLAGPASAWAVGLHAVDGANRPLTQRWDGATWTEAAAPAMGTQNALVAVSISRSGEAVATGFIDAGKLKGALIMRWNGVWESQSVPATGSGGATLIDVTASDASALAVGHRWNRIGQRPLAMAWDGASWRRADPALSPNETGSLLSVDGDTTRWAVGWVREAGARRPLILRREGSSWQRSLVPDIGPGPAALTAVDVVGDGDAWAVGFRLPQDTHRPLVLHWDGASWEVVGGLDTIGDPLILRGISALTDGTAWAVGTRYDPSTADFRAFAARYAGGIWEVDPSLPGLAANAELLDIDGDLSVGGWAVGQTGIDALLVRACEEPAGSGPPGSKTAADGAPRHRSVGGGGHGDGHGPEIVPLPRPIPQAYEARHIETATAVAGLSVRDVAVEAGLAEITTTWGGTTADFNLDGWPDLFHSRHGSQGRWLINDNGVFSEVDVGIGRADRHGCDSGDVTGDGRPDVYCAIGGERGQGLKTNELWIPTVDGPPTDESMGRGVADAHGRGRLSRLFDVDGDGDLDLFVGNEPDRVDGIPSPNRLYRNDGSGVFSSWRGMRLDRDIGAQCAEPADFDLDGRLDLLVCPLANQAPSPLGLRLFRNEGSTFGDVTASKGITALGEVDSALVDLSGDGRPDLVQLSRVRLRVSIQRPSGAFRTVYERSTSGARALAVADVDGDGFPDLYIVRGTATANPADVMLLNTGQGRGFTSLAVPQAAEGSGEQVVAIDHDLNGMTDLLVLNGFGGPGPIQLLAFFPATP